MKFVRLVLLLFIFSLSLPGIAQVNSKVKFSYAVSKKDFKKGDTVDFIINAAIDEGWYLYSTEFAADGPIKFEVIFSDSSAFHQVGAVMPYKPFAHYDSTWEAEVKIFEKSAQFRVPLLITKDGAITLKGKVEGQLCQEQCIPVKEKFSVDLSTLPVGEYIAADESVYDHYHPEKKNDGNEQPKVETPKEEAGGLWGLLLGAFLAGLSALITPCVFPMIPMTVSFFTKQDKSGKRDAIIYGISIIVIYTLIGVLCSVLFGKNFAQILSTHWIPNVIFFLVFIVFGISFLGMFEIVLPSSLTTKIDKMSEKGGMIGIFFMALTLVVVSFSCTAPVASSVLILASKGNFAKAIPAMLAFSSAIAIPFMIFAFFPNLMQKLPKSGGWLNSVKVVLGFVEIAFAFKFLSVADLAYHWNLLDREIYLVIWIVLSFLLGVYLLGKLLFPHDSPMSSVPVPRFLLAVVFFCFSLYMVPGLWGAPLKFLSGILPPQTTLDFDLSAAAYHQQGSASGSNSEPDDRGTVLYADIPLKQPLGIRGFFDLKQGVEYAKKKNKPILLDFTGHGCTNCRKMEDEVWSNPEVLDLIKNKYVLISLYYDEKNELPAEEQYKGPDGDMITSIGDKNLDFQTHNYGSNAAPLYVVLGHTDYHALIPPVGYTPNKEEYIKYLQDGIKAFEESK